MRLALALLLLWPGQPWAAELACPPALAFSQASRVTPPPGWQAVQRPESYPLEFAELFVGDPAKQVQLRGEDADYPRLVHWDLTPEPEGYTLVCRYQNTQVVLQAAVAREARRCEVRTNGGNGQPLRRGQAVPREARVVVVCR